MDTSRVNSADTGNNDSNKATFKDNNSCGRWPPHPDHWGQNHFWATSVFRLKWTENNMFSFVWIQMSNIIKTFPQSKHRWASLIQLKIAYDMTFCCYMTITLYFIYSPKMFHIHVARLLGCRNCSCSYERHVT